MPSPHRLNKSQRGGWLLLGPYSEDLRSELLHEIPVRGRRWDPAIKAWRISDDCAPAVQALLDRRAGEA